MSKEVGKTRIAITLADDIITKMDNQCKTTGLTRSAYLTMLINEAVLSQDLTTQEVLNALENSQFFEMLKIALENDIKPKD